jgi:hypothetical protein
MTAETPPAPVQRRLGPIPLPRNIGPLMLIIISALGIGAVLWGELFADPGIEVDQFDAGAETAVLDTLRTGEVLAFPDVNLYLVGLEDGRLRAVDGRVESSGCNVELLPGDTRGLARNPNGTPGVLEDPCSGAIWSVDGDAISGTSEPLRTPNFSIALDDEGVRHVYIEVITVGGD